MQNYQTETPAWFSDKKKKAKCKDQLSGISYSVCRNLKPTQDYSDCYKLLSGSELRQVATPVPTELPGLRPGSRFSNQRVAGISDLESNNKSDFHTILCEPVSATQCQ